MTTVTSPATLLRISQDVFPAFAMLAAMELDVFSPLTEPLTVDEVAGKLALEPERVRHLLHVLHQVKLLDLDGERFRNTAETEMFLVRGKPTYIGDVHGFFRVLWGAALDTGRSIRSGEPQARWMSLPAEDRRAYLDSLRVTAGWTIGAILARFELPSTGTFADVGGGTGVVALALTSARPGLHGTVIEHPEQAPMTRDRIASLGAEDRVSVVAADIVTGPLTGSYDFAILRSVLQMFLPDDAIRVLRNVRDTIVPGGSVFIAYEFLDDSRLGPPAAVLYNLSHSSLYDHGRAYTESDVRGWLEAAGYVSFERFVPPTGQSVIRARVPA